MRALGLTEYIEKLEAEGFDDWDALKAFDKDDFESMAQSVQMKAGHKMKLSKAIGIGKDKETPRSSLIGQSASVPVENCINNPGYWDFMVSYTQRGNAKALALEVYSGLVGKGYTGWLDTKVSSPCAMVW